MQVKKKSLAQVKYMYEYNLRIFCVKLGEKVSTYVNHAGENLPIDPTLYKSHLISKTMFNFEDGGMFLQYFK